MGEQSMTQDKITVTPITARGLALVSGESAKAMRRFREVATAAGFVGVTGGWIHDLKRPGAPAVVQGWSRLADLVARGGVTINLVLDVEAAYDAAAAEHAKRAFADTNAELDAIERETVADNRQLRQWTERLAGIIARRGCTFAQAERYAVEDDHVLARSEHVKRGFGYPVVNLPPHPDHVAFRDLGRQIGKGLREVFEAPIAQPEPYVALGSRIREAFTTPHDPQQPHPKPKPGVAEEVGRAVYGVHERQAVVAPQLHERGSEQPMTSAVAEGRAIVRAQVRILRHLRDSVLPGWVDTDRENHEAMNRSRAYEAIITPEDVRVMIADAASDYGVEL